MKICTICKKLRQNKSFYTRIHRTGNIGKRSCCRWCFQIKGRKYDIKNAEDIKKRKHKYYLKNKKSIIERTTIYRIKHPELKKKHAKTSRIWVRLNRKWINEYERNRRKTDIRFKLRMNLSNRVKCALKGQRKSIFTMFLVGCELDYLMYYIQCKFKKGMNWVNYGLGKHKWELDHIKACGFFDLTKISEQRKCFHYTNLQPLWKKEHREKTNKEMKRLKEIARERKQNETNKEA